ncbi:chalcone-flavanone isomerase-domain-containing protein [Amylostereum chailletii]|nr:chalcone-flavanone isomerase-domain-containing protein [Amylostereum chailletii]
MFHRLSARYASRVVSCGLRPTQRLFSNSIAAHPPLRNKPLLWGSLLVFPVALAGLTGVKRYRWYAHASTQSLSTSLDHPVDPDTSIEFPKHLRIQSKVPFPAFTLLGVGVRTVSFLGIKVYSVGFYADLSNPNLKISASASPEEKIEYIIQNTSCVLRIVPTRNTSYTHLRDAFVRTLQARQQRAHSEGTLSADEQLSVQAPIGKLKTIFPNAPFAKHTPLDILLTAPDSSQPRTLIIRDLGAVPHDWVATQVMLSYFDGHGNSAAMKKSVLDSLKGFGSS